MRRLAAVWAPAAVAMVVTIGACGKNNGSTPTHACPAFTFSVGSTTVTTNASTKFEHTSCAGVVNGITVEVKGTRASANAITAARVEKQ